MDLAIEPYGILSVTTSTPNVLFTKENLPESRIALHIYTNNDGQFVQDCCIGGAEISTKVTWSFSRIVVHRTPPHRTRAQPKPVQVQLFSYAKSPKALNSPSARVWSHRADGRKGS